MLFAKSDKVVHRKARCGNRYGIDLPFLTKSLLDHANEILSAVLVVHGDKAYSMPASKEAYAKLKGASKRLFLIPDAKRTDLYDQMNIIPFDEIAQFYRDILV
ncbi:MAG: lysophospholipase [Desulfovibrio sp.]|nr:lysophospholipase [Desulfovibrio sp.]